MVPAYAWLQGRRKRSDAAACAERGSQRKLLQQMNCDGLSQAADYTDLGQFRNEMHHASCHWSLETTSILYMTCKTSTKLNETLKDRQIDEAQRDLSQSLAYSLMSQLMRAAPGLEWKGPKAICGAMGC